MAKALEMSLVEPQPVLVRTQTADDAALAAAIDASWNGV